MRMPERRQNRAVSSRRGLTQPRGPASTRIAGSKVTPARYATPIPIADDTPTVVNTPILAKLSQQKSDSHRGGGRGDHLSDRDHRRLDRLIEIRTRPQIVVIAADEEDRVIRSGAGDDRAQEDDGLVRHARAGQFRVAGHHGLRDHQRRPDRRQWQQHGDRVAVHQQQHGEHQDGDRDLDRHAIVFALRR